MAESEDPFKGLNKVPNLFKDTGYHENRIVRAVPLVYYEGSRRHIVGSAVVREDGSFTAEIDPEARERVKTLLETRSMGQISIAFDPPVLPLDAYPSGTREITIGGISGIIQVGQPETEE
jgi:hypothetical protein